MFGLETINTTVVKPARVSKTPIHAHPDPIEEYYVVLKGTTKPEVKDPETGEIKFIEGAKPNTTAYFPPGVENRPTNNDDEPTGELGFMRREEAFKRKNAARENIPIDGDDRA